MTTQLSPLESFLANIETIRTKSDEVFNCMVSKPAETFSFREKNMIQVLFKQWTHELLHLERVYVALETGTLPIEDSVPYYALGNNTIADIKQVFDNIRFRWQERETCLINRYKYPLINMG